MYLNSYNVCFMYINVHLCVPMIFCVPIANIHGPPRVFPCETIYWVGAYPVHIHVVFETEAYPLVI